MELNSVLNSHKQQIIEDFIKSTMHLPGSLAELGVYQGGNALRMARAGKPKKIYLFDTFTGIPEKTLGVDVHDIGDFYGVDFESIKRAFQDFNAVFCKGVFPGTTIGIEDTFSVVHLDADQYQTTATALRYFYPKLDSGGVILLDDYEWPNCPGIKQALTEFVSCHPELVINSKSSCQAYIVKPSTVNL